MNTLGWDAFCTEHQEKIDDLCPRCTIVALRAMHADTLDQIHEANDTIQSWVNKYDKDLPDALLRLLHELDLVLNGP